MRLPVQGPASQSEREPRTGIPVLFTLKFEEMKFYEIIRLESSGPDTNDFTAVKNLVKRGWLRKALEYLSEWDYGSENIAAAVALGKMRDTVTDPIGSHNSESVLYKQNGLYLCQSACPSGHYNAYYLVGGISEQALSEL